MLRPVSFGNQQVFTPKKQDRQELSFGDYGDKITNTIRNDLDPHTRLASPFAVKLVIDQKTFDNFSNAIANGISGGLSAIRNIKKAENQEEINNFFKSFQETYKK